MNFLKVHHPNVGFEVFGKSKTIGTIPNLSELFFSKIWYGEFLKFGIKNVLKNL